MITSRLLKFAKFRASTGSHNAPAEETLLSLDGDAIRQVDYTDTEHYRVTKQFLSSPEHYFRHLFSDESDDNGKTWQRTQVRDSKRKIPI